MLVGRSEALHYSFSPARACNMCGAPPERLAAVGMRLNRSQGLRPKRLTGIAVGVRRCTVCGLIFADPQPLPDRLEDHYGSPDEFWHEEYFEDDASYFATEIGEAKALIGPGDRPRALDIGAGIGKAMQRLSDGGFDTYGIEPSEAFRNIALKRGLPPGKLALAGIEEAKFEPGTFDFITFGAVLEHLSNPADALSRALSWLKPGGIIQAEVPSSDYLVARLVNLYFRLRGTNYVTNISPMHSPFHLFEFGLKSFRLHGKTAGYEIASHRFAVGEVLHFPEFLHPVLRWYMERTRTGMQLTVYLRKTASGGVMEPRHPAQ